jgi:hypothetical protein
MDRKLLSCARTEHDERHSECAGRRMNQIPTRAWVSRLDAFAAYKWPLIALAIALLAYGFFAAYVRPKRVCAAGTACEVCRSNRTVRIALWIAPMLTSGGIVFEHIEPMLTHSSR